MIVKGILKWAKCYPNNYDTFKGVKRWMVNVVPSAEDAEKLIAEGLDTAIAYGRAGAKEKNKDGEWEFRFKRKVELASGATKSPPVIIDAEGNPFSQPIGNGTIANIQYTTYEYEGKKYNDLQGVQILEYVSFDGGQADGAEFTTVTPKADKKQGTGDDVPFAGDGKEENPFG